MLWLLYVFGVLMVWYENYWIARSYPVDRPPWYSPEAQTVFFVFRIVVTYGAVAALWYKRGFLTAVIAYAAYFIFNKGSLHIYFNKELKRATDRWVDYLNREAAAKQLPSDQAAIKKEAAKYAALQVRGNVQGKREWEIAGGADC